jgi:hypothetical protein
MSDDTKKLQKEFKRLSTDTASFMRDTTKKIAEIKDAVSRYQFGISTRILALDSQIKTLQKKIEKRHLTARERAV